MLRHLKNENFRRIKLWEIPRTLAASADDGLLLLASGQLALLHDVSPHAVAHVHVHLGLMAKFQLKVGHIVEHHRDTDQKGAEGGDGEQGGGGQSARGEAGGGGRGHFRPAENEEEGELGLGGLDRYRTMI